MHKKSKANALDFLIAIAFFDRYCIIVFGKNQKDEFCDD
jgi:hypothetical protein